MSHTASRSREPRRRRFPVGALSAVEILVLGPLAAFLVLWVVPAAFEIEWQCIGTTGVQRVAGDSYVAGVTVAGTFGWLAVAVGAIYAQISESRRLAVLLPLVWFAFFVLAALIGAVSLGSQTCPS